MRKIGLNLWELGDSITNGYLLTDTANRYSDLVAKSLKSVRQTFQINDGHNSWTSTQLLTLIKSKAKNFDADIITILCGTNDLASSVPTSTYQSNLTEMVNSIKQHKIDGVCDIYICGLTPRFDAKDVTPFVTVAQNVATSTGVNFVDLSSVLPNTSYTFDGYHPNDAGHALMANALWSAINARSSVWNK